MSTVALHGFGRIGRTCLRVCLHRGLFVPFSISDIRDVPTLAALFEVDTNYGRGAEPIVAGEHTLTVGGRPFRYFNAAQELPNWGELGVEVVIDCRGRATSRAGAEAHLQRGAKRVLVSGPS